MGPPFAILVIRESQDLDGNAGKGLSRKIADASADGLGTHHARNDVRLLLARAERLLTYSGGGKYEGAREDFDRRSYKVWADPGMNFVPTFTWACVLTGDKIWRDAVWSVLKWECQVRSKLNQNEFRFEFMTKSNGLNAALA